MVDGAKEATNRAPRKVVSWCRQPMSRRLRNRQVGRKTDRTTSPPASLLRRKNIAPISHSPASLSYPQDGHVRRKGIRGRNAVK